MAGRKKSPWNDNNDDNENPWEEKEEFLPPELDELFRKSQEKVRRLMRKPEKNGFNPASFLWIVLAVLAVWGLTGFYQVQPEEQGVVLRFGRYAYTTAPGLHYHFPYPIEEVRTPNVARENRLEIGFRPARGKRNGTYVQNENIALTGDENIVEINFTVTWKVKNAGDFLFNVRNPEATVRVAAESAMREAIGVTPIMQIIADDRKGVQEAAENTLQRLLDEYKSGITVTSIQLTKADAPVQVIDAFNDVQRAKADKERLANEAEAYRNDVLPKARGEASRLISAAEAYKAQVIDNATGDSERFKSVMNEYKNAKDVVAARLYLETMEKVYKTTNKIVVSPSASSVVPYLPLTEISKKTEQK